MVKVEVQQAGVDDVGHGKGGAVGDAPQGGQHVTVADQLQRPGQVERLIQQPQVTGGGLALAFVPLTGCLKTTDGSQLASRQR